MVNLSIAYSEKQVTPLGGMSLMKRFIDQTGIRELLNTMDLPQTGSNRGYDPKHIIESFWFGVWTGASRCIHCDRLQYDKTLHDIFDWDEIPSQSTYSRFFGKFSLKRNTEVFSKMENWFFDQIKADNITVDFDSTVITRYGDQQGSAALDALRSNSDLSSAMITTYNQDPLVGITSQTDPNGRTIYHEHDDFGRLKRVKDNDGNIVSKNEYPLQGRIVF